MADFSSGDGSGGDGTDQDALARIQAAKLAQFDQNGSNQPTADQALPDNGATSPLTTGSQLTYDNGSTGTYQAPTGTSYVTPSGSSAGALPDNGALTPLSPSSGAPSPTVNTQAQTIAELIADANKRGPYVAGAAPASAPAPSTQIAGPNVNAGTAQPKPGPTSIVQPNPAASVAPTTPAGPNVPPRPLVDPGIPARPGEVAAPPGPPGQGQGGGGVQNQAGGGDGSASSGLTSLASAAQEAISLANQLKSQDPDVQAIYAKQAQQVLDMIDQQQAALEARAKAQGETIDPATQYTLSQLQKKLQDNIQATQEDLNRRGLYSSGILLDLESKARTGEASDEANVLGQRLSEIQKGLNAGMQNFSDQRISTVGKFGMQGADAFVQQSRDQNARRDQLINSVYGTRNENARAQAALAAQSANAAAQRQFDAAQNDANRQNGITLEQMREAAAAAARARTGGVSNQNVPTQINNPYGGSTKTPGSSADATNAAVNALGSYRTRADAEAGIAAATPGMQQAGVDLQAVQDALDSLYPPAVGRNDMPIDERQRVGGSI